MGVRVCVRACVVVLGDAEVVGGGVEGRACGGGVRGELVGCTRAVIGTVTPRAVWRGGMETDRMVDGMEERRASLAAVEAASTVTPREITRAGSTDAAALGPV